LKNPKRFVLRSATIVLLSFLLVCASSCCEIYPTTGFGTETKESQEERTEEKTGGVSWEKEIRGVYIASVGNINFPSRSGLSERELKAEMDAIIENVKSIGFNTVYFQVRPTGDALYFSELFPTSRYLVKKEGEKAPIDVLSYFVEKGKEAGIETVAWVNPYRITNFNSNSKEEALLSLSENNPARQHPEWTVFYGGKLYYDPGFPEVRDLIAQGLKELCLGYKIWGVLYDDYFYPYPVNGESFDDASSYLQYGQGKELGDWRRENVNQMVKKSFETIKEINPGMSFGISPFGIWQNQSSDPRGSETRGLEAYKTLYCDALDWIEGEYVDYISPQIYWEKGYAAADFDVLCRWWSEQVEGTCVRLCISHAAYKAATFALGGKEIFRQITYAENYSHSAGSIQYGYKDIQNNTAGVLDELRHLFSTVKDGATEPKE